MLKFKDLIEKEMKGEDPCWDTHQMIGMKKGKGGKPVPNCVPKEEYKSDAQRKAVWAARNEKGIKEEDELIEAKIPVEHAVKAVTTVLGSQSAARFATHLRPGTEKHTSWDKVNNALKKQGVKPQHIADIAVHVRPAQHEEVELDEVKSSLPPHLQKLVKDKNLDKKPMTMVTPSQKEKLKAIVRDVTPKGYGPNEEVELEEAKGSLTYKPEHAKWGVVPKSSKEFVKFFPKDKEAEAKAHAEKTGGTLKKIDQAGRSMKEEVEQVDEISTELKQKYLGAATKKHLQQFLGRAPVRDKQELDKRRAAIQKTSKELTGKTHYQEETELDESLKTHYQNGYDAQKKGKTRQDNPHREGTPAASMWAKGWEHSSDKREPQKFANEEVNEGLSVKTTDATHDIVNSKGKVVKQFHKTPKGLEYAHQYVKQNKGNTGLEEEEVMEGSILKSIKRGLQGWDKNAVGPGGEKLGDPKDIVKRAKAMDTDTAKKVRAGLDGASDHSPAGLQKRVLDRKLKGVAEGFADDFLKMAKEKNPNARISTSDQRKKEAEELAKKRAHLKPTGAGPSGNPRPLGGYDPKSGRSYSEEVEEIDELSKSTLGSYIKKRSHDVATQGALTRQGWHDSEKARDAGDHAQQRKSQAISSKALAKGLQHRKNIAKAVDRLTKEEVELDEGVTVLSGRPTTHAEHHYSTSAGFHSTSHVEKTLGLKRGSISKDKKTYIKHGDVHVRTTPAGKHVHVSLVRKFGKFGQDTSKHDQQRESLRAKLLKTNEEVELDEEQLDELSKSTLGSYIKKRSHDVATQGALTRQHAVDSEKARQNQDYTQQRKSAAMSDKAFVKGWQHRKNIAKAVDKMAKEEVELDEGDELGIRMGSSGPGFNKTPAGKAREVKRKQEHLKGQMKFTKSQGGVSGPKGKLPEEVEESRMLSFGEFISK